MVVSVVTSSIVQHQIMVPAMLGNATRTATINGVIAITSGASMQGNSDQSVATALPTGLHTTAHSAVDHHVELAPLYHDENDRSRHLHNMARLAEEIAYPVHLIEPLYEQMLAQLKLQATVHDYLPILVAKNVRHAIKESVKQH